MVSLPPASCVASAREYRALSETALAKVVPDALAPIHSSLFDRCSLSFPYACIRPAKRRQQPDPPGG